MTKFIPMPTQSKAYMDSFISPFESTPCHATRFSKGRTMNAIGQTAIDQKYMRGVLNVRRSQGRTKAWEMAEMLPATARL